MHTVHAKKIFITQILPHHMTSAHLAQKVERWPFKPMVVGSIPTVGVIHTKFFFYVWLKKFIIMQSVGFEPTHPKILRPERSALDRSAKIA